MNYKPLKKIGIYEFLPIINREKQERRKGVREKEGGNKWRKRRESFVYSRIVSANLMAWKAES